MVETVPAVRRWQTLSAAAPFAALTLLVAALTAAKASAGSWTGDFWSHSAAVHELGQRWPAPRHPEIDADLPGCFYTPYTLAVALAARITGTSAVAALGAAGVINVLLLFSGLRFWIGTLLPEAPRDPTALFAAVLMLLFWGAHPWIWSGFFHLESLPLVAPYPSTFAAAITFAALGAYGRWVSGGGWPFIAATLAAAALLPLTHAPTTIVFGVGLAAHSLAVAPRRHGQRAIALAAAVALGALLAAWWPLYPFFDLLRESADYHETNAAMYHRVLVQAWPAAIRLPVVVSRLRSRRSDTLGLLFLGLTLCYAYGWVSGKLAYGRVLPYQLLVLQIAIAGWVTGLATTAPSHRRKQTMAASGLGGVAVALTLVVAINERGLNATITQHPDWTSMYRFLPAHVGQDEVVLADPITGYPVPSFAGKVVAHVGNLDLVPDAAERLREVDAFFSEDISDDERARVIARYRVRWLLLAREHPLTPYLLGAFGPAGTITHANAELTLLDLRSAPRLRGSSD